MKKLIGALLATSLFAQPASATELNSDTGFDNPSAWMLDPASPNLWTVSGSKANGNGAKAMQMLMGANTAIKRGKTYRWSLDVAGMTHGVIEMGVGPTMTKTATGAWVNSVTPISDNFVTANGLYTTGSSGSGAGPDGAFRIFCGDGVIDNNDPVVNFGQQGVSHTHQSWGNTNSLDPRGNYQFYRTTGGTTCANVDSQSTPIDRAAYWMPAMLDGKGNAVRPEFINQYYKGYSAHDPVCNNPANSFYAPGAGGACVDIPTGLVMIGGYNFSTGLGGPADNGFGFWTCQGEGTYHDPVNGFPASAHLKDFFAGGCALPGQGGNAPGQGGILAFKFVMPMCWDGVHTDSPDHRAHVAYGTRSTSNQFPGCSNTHPYHFAAPNPLVYWIIDQNFYDGKWHLSSDEMVSGKVSTDPGGTMHMDFTEAWSPTVRALWHQYCIDGLTAPKSCGSGALGNGQEIKGNQVIAATGLFPNDPPSHAADKGRYYPLSKIGIGKPITANGTYSGEIVADADGRFSLIAIEDSTGAGFNGTVDNLTITEITSGHKGPVTITH